MRTAVAVAAVAALLAGLPATAGAATKEGGGAHADAAEGAGIDLTSIALGQKLGDLTLTARTAAPLTDAALAPAGGGELCLRLTPAAGAERRLCVTRAAGRWALTDGARAVAGEVGQASATTLTVRVTPAVLGLDPGPLRWSVFARAAGCQATAGAAQTGPGGVSGPDEAPGAETPTQTPGAAPCGDRAPDTGDYAGRVWRVVVTGCTATGASEVLHGPVGKRIALTYDDGPSAMTGAFLDELDRLRVPATFFLVGKEVGSRAALVRRMLASGDMVGNHTWSHANVGGGGPGATSQMERASAAIRRVSGFTPCLFRPPYGATGPDLVSRARAAGMASILWSVDPSDYATPGVGAIVSRVLAQAGSGAIILDHDGGGPRAQTLAALPLIVAALRAKGYTFVTVTDLLGYRNDVSLRR